MKIYSGFGTKNLGVFEKEYCYLAKEVFNGFLLISKDDKTENFNLFDILSGLNKF